MATVRRIGFGTIFELENDVVGIGTDNPTHKLQALGNIRSEAATDIGISTFSTYQGFTDKEARFTTGQIDNQSQSGSTSGEIVIDGDVTVSSATTFTSGPQNLSVTDTFTLPSGDTNSRELKPTPGSLRFNQDFATLEFYTGNNWATVNAITDIQNSPSTGNLGLFVGGNYANGDTSKQIESINISSRGNAVDFGEMTDIRVSLGACANRIRGVFMGGSEPGVFKNVIDYVTMSSKSDAQDFGDLIIKSNGVSCLCSSTRGFRIGGANSDGTNAPNTIEYVQINTLGNALDFGDLTINRNGQPGSASSPVRGIVCGSYTGTPGVYTSAIDSFTMASLGNATKFGDCINESGQQGTVSNSVRAVLHTGRQASGTGQISFITIASEGNAIEFGSLDPSIHDVTNDSMFTQGCSNHTRAVWLNGNQDGNFFNGTGRTVSIEIATGGRAVSFGDASRKMRRFASCSNAHGGLGGF